MAFPKEVLDEILKDYQSPDDFYGPEGIMKQLSKARVERTMEVELTEQLGYAKHDQAEKPTTNRLNGKTAKELRTDHGPKEIAVPHDRKEVFEPKIIPKHQKAFRGFDDNILSMYVRGLPPRQIQEQLKDIYAVAVSPELVSRISDEVKELAALWRGRVLELFYPVVFLAALRVNIRDGGVVIKKSVYLPLRYG
jgi:transposase-like protein